MNSHNDDMNAEDRDAFHKISDIYRMAAQEEPAPGLDAQLRAAAARTTRPTRGSLRSWRPALATAAVMLLIAGMLHETPPASPPQPAARTDQAPRALVSPAVVAPFPVAQAPSPAVGPRPRIFSQDRGQQESEADRITQRMEEAPMRQKRALEVVPAEAPAAASASQAPAPAAAPPPLLVEGQQTPARDQAESAPAPMLKDQAQRMDRPQAEALDKNPAADGVSAVASPAGTVQGALRQEKMEKAMPDQRGLARVSGGLPQDNYDISNKVSQPEYGTTEKWLDHIRELRRQGREAEARKSLAGFRKHYPGYVLPAALQDMERPLPSALQNVPAPPPAVP